jgi:hypothetical protein
MTQAGNTLVASAAVIALTLGVTGETAAPRDEPPLSTSDIVIAAEEGALPQAEPEENAEPAAPMGEEEDGPASDDLGAMPESAPPDDAPR